MPCPGRLRQDPRAPTARSAALTGRPAPLGQQLFDIAEAEGKAKIQPHGVPDDVRRELVASE
jgi:hypothetical protein